MLEDVLENRHRILFFIQFDVLQKKSVEEAYENFCKVLGEDVMKFKEYDYWFYHFANGNFDLDHVRNEDRKAPELSDIPIEIIDKILENLKIKERCNFRNVSKKCREFIDENPIIIDEIKMEVTENGPSLTVDGESFKYRIVKSEDIILVENGRKLKKTNNDVRQRQVLPKNYRKEREEIDGWVLKKLASFLKFPNIRIKKLLFSFGNADAGELLQEFLESLDHQIHVEYFRHDDCDPYPWRSKFKFCQILPYLKPGVLKTIFLSSEVGYYIDIELDYLTDLEQWKQAKHLKMKGLYPGDIVDLIHFKTMELDVCSNVSEEEVVSLKDSFLTSPNFEKCHLNGVFEADSIREELGSDRFPMTNGSTLHVDVSQKEVIFRKE